MATLTQEQKAIALYHAYFNRAPKHEEIFGIELPGKTYVLAIGFLDGVLYSPIGEDHKEPYEHSFAENNRPLLCVSFDGTQIFIYRGRYRFTDRGFIG